LAAASGATATTAMGMGASEAIACFRGFDSRGDAGHGAR
jgi:hypothetical protein